MKRQTFYRASRLDEILPPPDGEEFNPHRDTRYSSFDSPDFAAAVAYAAKDYHEYGRVEERISTRFIGVSNVVAEWGVFPDETTEAIES